jgi:hypothetical protein
MRSRTYVCYPFLKLPLFRERVFRKLRLLFFFISKNLDHFSIYFLFFDKSEFISKNANLKGAPPNYTKSITKSA